MASCLEGEGVVSFLEGRDEGVASCLEGDPGMRVWPLFRGRDGSLTYPSPLYPLPHLYPLM